ncbi:CRISPR-associated helicase/endonuclease Cas3 [Kyrpidia tusciae]|uniref:CRISPR-associated helicase Cas3 n=1 Tax=Kyrpidia tusciae (strain DSM 2912 / NBRC 15312 / T2) TaxID=562970 RepID=D5WUB1_KYRT2|nr:CRISPR-associated helicase/endonuclease Cas3 [Kyrpidia tusciae]ADG07363.1 CRISPR-associated helicase Cas3 [Kyrpidia tusciae DSM 2912]
MADYYAHYDKASGVFQRLSEHLRSVATSSANAVPVSVSFPSVPNEVVRELVWWVGYLHDLGKFTDFFQDYLVNGEASPYRSSPLKQHAHISALYVHGLAAEQLLKKIPEPHRAAVAFLAYVAVRRHHGHLTLKGLFAEPSWKRRWKSIVTLAEHLNRKALEILDQAELTGLLDERTFLRMGDPGSREADERHFIYAPQYLSGRWKDAQWYFLLVYLFSSLIDADKLDSAGVSARPVAVLLPAWVQRYLERKHAGHQTRLAQRRESARKTILARLDALSDDEIRDRRFFAITAPTGIGKTLAALQCAFRLQERIRKVEGYTPRIITAIPFINIIEQTRRDYERVVAEQEHRSTRLVVHHSLSDLRRKEALGDSVPLDRALLEVESWEGDIILTTFVQLFHSMLTGNNRMLKKIHKLAGAVVILDEVQAIPDKYQPLIGALLWKLGEMYGTRFILMTATQPRILEFGDLLLGTEASSASEGRGKAIELLEDHARYFSEQRRTKLVPKLAEPLETESFVSLVGRVREPCRSVLVVVNTIRRSIEVYRVLKKWMDGEPDKPKVLYLSTNIIPRQRRRVIRLARRLLRQGYPVLMVSTQTIEAGVDLDFDLGFRDMAPLESIIQTAGRVNRDGKKGEFCPVYVVRLQEDGKEDGQRVYALHHMDRTRRLIEAKAEILEPAYGELVKEYYDRALADGVADESRELWEEGVKKLNFDVLDKFQLIANSGEVVDVFVETEPDVDRGSMATALADAYEMVRRADRDWDCGRLVGIVEPEDIARFAEPPNSFERKALIRTIRAKMSDYIIQLRAHRAAKNPPQAFSNRGGIQSDLYWVPPGNLKELYDPDTGFKDDSGVQYIY